MSIILSFGLKNACAVEKIVGAFGMEFGKKFNPSTATYTYKSKSNTSISYRFKPKSGFRSFSTYTLSVTPKTGLIYRIIVWGDMQNLATCKSEQNVIMSILERKYGKAIEHDIGGDSIGNKRIDQDNMFVWTACSRGRGGRISIGYGDRRLRAQAEKERIELETEKVDASGL